MKINFTARRLNPQEERFLFALKKRTEKAGFGKFKPVYFIIAALTGVLCIYFITIIPDSFSTFLLGTIVVFCFSFLVFVPFELFTMKRKHRDFLNELISLIQGGHVGTSAIDAIRVALAAEFEDEGDLYIIETGKDELLYIWDKESNLRKKFPCSKFEVYDDRFSELTGRVVNPLSEKIQPIHISPKAKWNYMKQFGFPGHAETEKASFSELLERINTCG